MYGRRDVTTCHGNAPPKTHKDQPDPELGFIWKKGPSEAELAISCKRAIRVSFTWRDLTIRNGAIIQFISTLNEICFQRSRCAKSMWSDSYRTLQRMGYIMTSSPTADGAIC